MGQVYYQLYYHVVWATYRRLPFMTAEIEKVLYPFLENKSRRFGCRIHGVNGVENHVHIAISIPPAASVSDIIGKLKGSGSYFLNQELRITDGFSWQDGFGVLSFAKKDLPRVLSYIARQKEHHESATLNDEMELVDCGQNRFS